MYEVYYNTTTMPVRLAEWLNDMHHEGRVLVAATEQLYIFKQAQSAQLFYMEYVDSEHIRLTPITEEEYNGHTTARSTQA